jgi:hypothetical protein
VQVKSTVEFVCVMYYAHDFHFQTDEFCRKKWMVTTITFYACILLWTHLLSYFNFILTSIFIHLLYVHNRQTINWLFEVWYFIRQSNYINIYYCPAQLFHVQNSAYLHRPANYSVCKDSWFSGDWFASSKCVRHKVTPFCQWCSQDGSDCTDLLNLWHSDQEDYV